MQISQLQASFTQTLDAASICSCGGIVATIACAIFAAIIVSSALVLTNVIALSIPIALLIIAIAISALAMGRLCCYIHKSLYTASSIPISTATIAADQELTANNPLTAAEKALLARNCFCTGCTFKPADVLNQDEQLVLNAWCATLYPRMNAVMAKQNDDPKIKHINQIAIKALSKLPPAPNQQYLIRGADFQAQAVIQIYPVGQKFTLDRFMSTTTSAEHQLPPKASDGNTRFYVKGITGKSIKRYACDVYKYEEEVLFAPGTQFVTKSVKLQTSPKQVFLQEVTT